MMLFLWCAVLKTKNSCFNKRKGRYILIIIDLYTFSLFKFIDQTLNLLLPINFFMIRIAQFINDLIKLF